jgi:RNA polymerase sigma factor (sigma-70 family)
VTGARDNTLVGRDINELVRSAGEGNHAALEAVVRAVSNDVYRLALRMTGNVADAEDATQEVLIKVITRLGSYRAESSLKTWAYQVAMNHLLDRRKSRVEELALDFDAFATDLLDGLSADASGYENALSQEVKLGCTLAMLNCLSRDDRAAYILGEVFDLAEEVAAQVLEISPVAFRQRLSRARRGVEGFTQSYCGLVDSAAPCHCNRRVARAIKLGRLTRENLGLVNHPRTADSYVQEMERLHSAAELMRSHPSYAAPEALLQTILGSLLFTRSDAMNKV